MSGWDRAFHAYGPARGGDVLLDVLRSGTEEAYVAEHPDASWWRQPYSFLWSGLYCMGRTTPATVLGLRHLIKAVVADDFGGADPVLRWAVLWWIRDVVRTAVTSGDLDKARLLAARRNEPFVTEWLEDHLRHERSILEWDDTSPGHVLTAAARVDCFDFLPKCFPPLSALLTAHQPEEVRAAAASAASMLVRHPALRHHRDQVAAYHADQARHGSPRHRASMLIGLGDLGVPTTPWLTDPDLGVRVCAALAPSAAGDETTVEVLRAASRDPALNDVFDGMGLHQLTDLTGSVAEALKAAMKR
ncbi:MAG TPA: HEAT repeat domain-containing protein [Actinoplanes sp.]|nr:HEAT repeat domain-containing protein [Actinoplanes sp.]